MKKIRNILENKGHQVYAVSPETSVYDALHMMMEKNISSLLIMENEVLKGIFTERDYARKLVLMGRSSRETPIGEIMTANLFTITPSETIDHCMEMMSTYKIRHLPVIDNNRVTGMVSIGDVVKFIIEDQKRTIQQLESYIAS
ncbi:CBS domain-containing protein [Mucilaginibacter paludis]|uniref:Signal transduction protein with CBS domains n=1 Tax=Mucilaginibacter paludis DSM 18603 TaxID=714943 RepID=H1XZL0_9SPHI|nr:CBS domain-containing protein [Mucilaginibacter paludis]EHQ26654.1 putative signal transduction protein with CBS domains [Mucilaginibacter paludis DSM 18603]